MDTNMRQIGVALGAPVLVGIAALAASVAIGSSVAAFVLGTAAIACVAVAAWRVTAIETERARAETREQTPAQIAIVRSDRRRPTFDRETGLLAEWYFRQRFEEEIVRAKRYGHALTALTVTAGTKEAHDTTRLAIRAYLRQVDFAGDLSGVIAICLPDTSRDAATAVVARMAELVGDVQVEAREYPDDGETLSALLNEHAWHTTPDETPESQSGQAAA